MSGLTRAQLDKLNPSRLSDLARTLQAQAQKLEPEQTQFSQRLRSPGGKDWTGTASDALQVKSHGIEKTYGSFAEKLVDGAHQCEQAGGFLSDSANTARQSVTSVEAETVTLGTPDGMFWPCGEPFQVADDFTVSVKPLPTGFPQIIFDTVQLMAAAHTEDIKRLVTQLEQLSDTWGGKIKAAFDFSGLALNSKGQPYAPYDPNNNPRDQAREIAEGTREIPSDPKQLHDLWQQLTPDEKDAIYNRYHDIGNHGGIPFDPPDHRGRDYYNRKHLPEVEQKKQDEIDQWKAQRLPGWENHPPQDPVMHKEWQSWKDHLDQLQHELAGIKMVEKAVQPGQIPPRYLGIIDDQGHVSVSINNPDLAKKNATLVPGTFGDEFKIGDYDSRGLRFYEASIKESGGRLSDGDVSVSVWMGYDRPMSIGDPTDDHWAGDPNLALNGAKALDDMQAGIRASHDDNATGGPSYNTVIGHSYGTTEVGAAATHGNQLDADAVVLLASPGAFAGSAEGLAINENGKVFVAKSDIDLINVANFGYEIGLSDLGPDPADWGDAHQIECDNTGDHNSYWERGNPVIANIGRIIAGTDSATNVTPRK